MLLSEGPPRSVSPTEPGVGETDWPVSLRVPPVSASPSAKFRACTTSGTFACVLGIKCRSSCLQTEPSPRPLNAFLQSPHLCPALLPLEKWQQCSYQGEAMCGDVGRDFLLGFQRKEAAHFC